MEREIKLETKLDAISNSQKTGKVYTAILRKKNDKLIVSIISECGNRTPGSWRVESIADHTSDIIYIDHGSKWAVRNVRALIGEILKVVVTRQAEINYL